MKIAVINLMHIGDLMLVTPTLTTLRKNFPTAHLTLLADKKLADLVQLNKNLDDCILIDKKGVDDNLFNLVKLIFKIRAEKFDLVINLHRNERASAMAAFSGAKKIVGYSKPGFSLLFDKVLPNPSIARHIKHGLKVEYVPGSQHQVHSHFDVLREACGIEKFYDNGLEMWISDAASREAEKIFRNNFSDGVKVIAFNIGASWVTKRWIDSYFAECADILIERGYGIAFLGGPMDREIVTACVDKMRHKASDRLKIFTGDLSLAVLAGFLDNCVLFLTTDSGPMHVGVARNIPIVTMFGASPVPGFYPYDAKDILVKSPVPCHPCGRHICPKSGADNLECMKKIPVAVVMKYVFELLETYGEPAKKIPRVHGEYQCRVIDLTNMP
ncbi:MAG: glycosyltransferase family 9 protein [Selenomonadaceae bacterium]|nr:glycosyltransferase family 9 protein [Selenomonadaceae bacterium]